MFSSGITFHAYGQLPLCTFNFIQSYKIKYFNLIFNKLALCDWPYIALSAGFCKQQSNKFFTLFIYIFLDRSLNIIKAHTFTKSY